MVHAQHEVYLDLARRSLVDEAVELCLSLLDRGASPEEITLELLRPVQREIGEHWALGAWSVAQEHRAPAVTRVVDVAAQRETTVLSGGWGFGRGGRYAGAVGVTAWEHDVPRAVRVLATWDATGPPSGQKAAPEPLAYRLLLRHRDDVAARLTDRLRADEVDPASREILTDAVEQVTALGLAAARIAQASILDEGIGELVAVLRRRGGPLAAAADRLPGAARAVFTDVAPHADPD